jgi:hypothetical protein
MAVKTSLYNLSSQILFLLTRIDKDLQIDRREVTDALRQASLKFLKQDYFETLKNGQRFIDPHYIAKFKNIEVKTDTDRYDRNYIDIPAQYVSLKNNEGIQRVWPVTEEEIDYREMIPVPDGTEELYYNLLVNKALIGVWTYSVNRDRIYFGMKDGSTLTEEKITFVDVDIVVISPVDIEDEDPFPLPVEYHFDLILAVIELFISNPERVRQLITPEYVNKVRADNEVMTKEFKK